MRTRIASALRGTAGRINDAVEYLPEIVLRSALISVGPFLYFYVLGYDPLWLRILAALVGTLLGVAVLGLVLEEVADKVER